MSKITAYNALAVAQSDDVLPIVDVHDTSMAASGTTKKITVANLIALSGAVNGTWSPGSGASGFLGWNNDPAAGSAGSASAAGTLYLQQLNFYQATTITNLWYWVTTAGAGASTGTFVGIYSSSGSLLTGSADMASKFTGSTGAQQCAVTTPQSFSAGSFCWTAVLCNLATTQVTLLRMATISAALNGNLTAANSRWGTAGTGMTALPATITPSSISQSTSFSTVVAWS